MRTSSSSQCCASLRVVAVLVTVLSSSLVQASTVVYTYSHSASSQHNTLTNATVECYSVATDTWTQNCVAGQVLAITGNLRVRENLPHFSSGNDDSTYEMRMEICRDGQSNVCVNKTDFYDDLCSGNDPVALTNLDGNECGEKGNYSLTILEEFPTTSGQVSNNVAMDLLFKLYSESCYTDSSGNEQCTKWTPDTWKFIFVTVTANGSYSAYSSNGTGYTVAGSFAAAAVLALASGGALWRRRRLQQQQEHQQQEETVEETPTSTFVELADRPGTLV